MGVRRLVGLETATHTAALLFTANRIREIAAVISVRLFRAAHTDARHQAAAEAAEWQAEEGEKRHEKGAPKLSAAELVWIRRAKRGVRVGPLSGWDELVASAVRTTARIVHLDDNFGDETRFAAPDVDASLVQADNHRVVLVCSDQVRRHAVALRTFFEVRSAAFLLASCIIVIIIVVVISVTGVQIRHNGSVDVVLTPLPA